MRSSAAPKRRCCHIVDVFFQPATPPHPPGRLLSARFDVCDHVQGASLAARPASRRYAISLPALPLGARAAYGPPEYCACPARPLADVACACVTRTARCHATPETPVEKCLAHTSFSAAPRPAYAAEVSPLRRCCCEPSPLLESQPPRRQRFCLSLISCFSESPGCRCLAILV